MFLLVTPVIVAVATLVVSSVILVAVQVNVHDSPGVARSGPLASTLPLPEVRVTEEHLSSVTMLFGSLVSTFSLPVLVTT